MILLLVLCAACYCLVFKYFVTKVISITIYPSITKQCIRQSTIFFLKKRGLFQWCFRNFQSLNNWPKGPSTREQTIARRQGLIVKNDYWDPIKKEGKELEPGQLCRVFSHRDLNTSWQVQHCSLPLFQWVYSYYHPKWAVIS